MFHFPPNNMNRIPTFQDAAYARVTGLESEGKSPGIPALPDRDSAGLSPALPHSRYCAGPLWPPLPPPYLWGLRSVPTNPCSPGILECGLFTSWALPMCQWLH